MMNTPKLVSAARPPLPPRKKKTPSSPAFGASHPLVRKETQTVEAMRRCIPSKGSHLLPRPGRLSLGPSPLSPYAAVMPPPSNETFRRPSSPDIAAARTSMQVQSCKRSLRVGVADVASVGEDAAAKCRKFAHDDSIGEDAAQRAAAARRKIDDVANDGKDAVTPTDAKRRNMDNVANEGEDAATHTAAKRRSIAVVVNASGDAAQHTAAKACKIAEIANAAEDAAPHTAAKQCNMADAVNAAEDAAPYTTTKRRNITDVANAGEVVPPHATAKRRRVTGMAGISAWLFPNILTSLPQVGVTKFAPTSAATMRGTSAAYHEIMAPQVTATRASAKNDATSHLIVIAKVTDGLAGPQLDVNSHQVRDTYPVASRCAQKRRLEAPHSERLSKRACLPVSGLVAKAEASPCKYRASKEMQCKSERKRCHRTSEDRLPKRCKVATFPTGTGLDQVEVC